MLILIVNVLTVISNNDFQYFIHYYILRELKAQRKDFVTALRKDGFLELEYSVPLLGN